VKDEKKELEYLAKFERIQKENSDLSYKDILKILQGIEDSKNGNIMVHPIKK
jgi:hypothetical protein